MAELNGKDILGRAVRINPGIVKKPDDQEQALRTKSYGKGWRTYQPQEGSKPSLDRWNRNDAQAHWNINRENQENQGPTKRLYIGNLPRMEPQLAVDKAIRGLFDPLGIEITAVSKIISPHESKKELGGDHYFLFVDLARAEDADIAIEALDGKAAPWGGEPTLRVNRAREQGGRRVQKEQVQRDHQNRKDRRAPRQEAAQ